MKRIHVAIVNSTSFGRYSDAVKELRKSYEVNVLMVPKDIDGKILAERLRGIDILVVSSSPDYTADFFENNLDVVSVVRHGIGVDNIDVNAATKSGTIVVRTPGVIEREAVAEHTIALMLSALRKVPQSYMKVREGKWAERVKFTGVELRGKTVGIIGLGNIGSRVAEILIKGFETKVLVYDPYLSEDQIRGLGGIPVDFETLLMESEIITLHCPLTDDTYHILDEDAFEKMREGTILINTGRGGLVDTNALIKALESGKLSCVALDVIEGEPIGGDHQILRFENVIITPHIAAYTFESLRGMDRHILNAINKLVKGEVPEGIVNEEVLTSKNLRLKKLLDDSSNKILK